MKRKIFGILFAVVLAVSLMLVPTSSALATITYVEAGNPVISLNGNPSGGQTFYVGQTITITGDVHSYAQMSGAGYNEAWTNVNLYLTYSPPSGPGSDSAWAWDGSSTYAVVDTNYSLTITYPLTATGTHTVYMWSYATVGSGRSDWGEDLLTFNVVPPVEVNIDIKPGSDPNSINPGDQGVLPVAILGSSIDVSTIDLDKPITLGGTSVTSRGPAKAPKLAVSFEDVDGDGLMDLVAFFRVQDLALDGTTELKLEAETTGGVPICGTDSVRIVPPE